MEYTILTKDGDYKFSCSSEAPASLQFFDTSFLTRVDTPAETLEGSYYTDDKNGCNLAEGDHILFKPDGKYREVSIQEINIVNGKATFYSENMIMELSNENALPLVKPSAAQPIEYYMKNGMLEYSNVKIGVNEVVNEKRQLEYTGTSDLKIARLIDILNAFDAEAEFLPVMKSGSVIGVESYVLNIYEKRGSSVVGDQLIDDINITSVETTRSIKDVRTCINLQGAQIEGTDNQYVNIINLDYDDGDYYSPKGASMLFSRKAMDKWLPVNEYDKGLLMSWSYDTADPNELLQRGKNELSKYDDVKVSFTIQGLIDGEVGNTVTVSTKRLGNNVYLSSRIIQKEVCFEDSSKNKTVIGDFVVRETELDEAVSKAIDASVIGISDEYAISRDPTIVPIDGWSSDTPEYVSGVFIWRRLTTTYGSGAIEVGEPALLTGNKGEDAEVIRVHSVNGNMFKNTGVATTLIVTIYVGKTIIDTSAKMREYFGNQAKIVWEIKKMGELEFTRLPDDDPRMSDNGFIFGVTPEDVCMKVTFDCSLDY